MNNETFNLKSVHEDFKNCILKLSNPDFIREQKDQSWSPSQILKHLVLVESAFYKELKKAKEGEVFQPFILKQWIPFNLLIQYRTVKVKSPALVNPGASANAGNKTELLTEWEQIFDSLKELYLSLSVKEWRKRRVKHPFFGELDGIMAYDFLANHEIRHLKQLKQSLLFNG